MAGPNPYKVITSCIEQLDSEMNSHQKSCKKCKTLRCAVWLDMLETFNFYQLAAIRAAKGNAMLPLNYEGGI